MKVKQKILLALTLMLVTIFTVLPSCCKATGENLSITVTGNVSGRTLSIYKLFDLEIVDGNQYYSWEGLPTKDFFTNKKGLSTIYETTEYLKGLESNSTNLTKLAEEYYNYCEDNNISELNKKVVGENEKQVTFSGLDKGYYLIYDETVASKTVAKSIGIVSNLTENTTVSIKVDSIEVDKTVDETSAKVGDDVNFTITSKVPEMIGYDEYSFVISDTLSKGLDLDEESIAISIGEDEYTNYSKSSVKNQDGTTTLTITFKDFIEQKVNSGKTITVNYTAKLNNEAAVEKDNTNSAKVIYSNDPTTDKKGETDEVVVHVYTYAVELTKKNSKGDVLSEVEFILKLGNGKYATFDQDGVFTGTVENKDDATILKTNSEGKIAISGLEAGEYELIETKTLDEYNLPNFGFSFRISQELNDDGTLKTASFDYIADEEIKEAAGYIEDVSSSTPSFEIVVLNAKKGLLPSTGGMGTILFTVTGIGLMIVAASVFVVRKKVRA